jgi:integral membrane protein (TIGR01906 family)
MKYILTALFVIIIIFGNLVFQLNSSGFYTAQSETLSTNASLTLATAQFIAGKAGLPEEFTEPEAAHLHDVRSLFLIIRYVYYTSLLLLLALGIILSRKKRFLAEMPRALFLSGSITLVVLAAALLLSLSNFSAVFNGIHAPFFQAGTWQFPQDSLLMTLFPESFFQSFTFSLFRLIFLNAALFFGFGIFISKKYKRRPQMNRHDSA